MLKNDVVPWLLGKIIFSFEIFFVNFYTTNPGIYCSKILYNGIDHWERDFGSKQTSIKKVNWDSEINDREHIGML